MQADRFRDGLLRMRSALLLLLASCSLEDPSGTSWESGFFLATAPETLRVRQAGESDRIAFRAGDSLLLFLQELESDSLRLADSLWWEGAARSLAVGPDRLRFTDLGGSGLVIALEELFPALADSLGSLVRLPEPIPFQLNLPLAPFHEVDWVHFLESRFLLEGEHDFVFDLDILEVDVYNSQGELLGGGLLQQEGRMPPAVSHLDELELLGLVTAELELRLSGHSLPLDGPRLLEAGSLQLGLRHDTGVADSARAHIGRQDFDQLDSLLADPELRVLEALSRQVDLSYSFLNNYPVPLSVEILLPQFRTPGGDTLRSLGGEVPPGEAVVIHDSQERIRFQDMGEHLPQRLPLLVRGHTLEQPGMQVLRTGDRLQLQVEIGRSRLSWFRGEFLQPYAVEVDERRYELEDFPEELANFRFRDVDMELRLASTVDMLFDLDLAFAVHSGNDLADTTLQLADRVDTAEGRMVLEGMGPFLERLPEGMDLAGELQILPGQELTIDSLSYMDFTQVVLPADLVVLEAIWESLPEESGVELGREVYEAGLELYIENEIPLGGTLQAWIAPGDPRSGQTDSLALFDPLVITPSTGAVSFDTLRTDIREQALRLMRGGWWEDRSWIEAPQAAGQWWGWYRFDAGGEEDTLSFHAGQELRVSGRITLLARLGDWQ